MADDAAKRQLVEAATVFVVRDVLKNIDYYQNALGFKLCFTYGEPVGYAGVERDGVMIHLFGAENAPRQAGQGTIYIFAHDVDAIYAEIVQRRAKAPRPPEDYPYGMRDFVAEDLDGNRLCFGMESKTKK